MSVFQTTAEFISWRTWDINAERTPFPLPTKDVEPADLRVGDVFTKCYEGETYGAVHLKKVIKKNKKTIIVQSCTSHGIIHFTPEKLPLHGFAYRVVDFYAQ